ncbi:MAG: hypothetical protein J6T47_03100 [Lachnospiraceae bacterium]|nr:hypothetical protein [Lachnospiraceae bacterium]
MIKRILRYSGVISALLVVFLGLIFTRTIHAGKTDPNTIIIENPPDSYTVTLLNPMGSSKNPSWIEDTSSRRTMNAQDPEYIVDSTFPRPFRVMITVPGQDITRLSNIVDADMKGPFYMDFNTGKISLSSQEKKGFPLGRSLLLIVIVVSVLGLIARIMIGIIRNKTGN